MKCQRMMMKASLILLMLVLATVARANPVLTSSNLDELRQPVERALCVAAAFLLEVVVVSYMLSSFGMAPIPTFIALVVLNIASYRGIVRPLAYQREAGVVLVEVAVVIAETAFVFLLSRFAFFRRDPSVKFKWRFALLAVLVGNAASFAIGLMAP